MTILEFITSPTGLVAVGTSLVALAAAFPKVVGGFSEGWEKWLESSRRSAELRDDADIADLRRQVEHLKAEVAAIRADIVRRDAALHDHSPWDYRAVQIIASLGGSIEPPPPLWPIASPPQLRTEKP